MKKFISLVFVFTFIVTSLFCNEYHSYIINEYKVSDSDFNYIYNKVNEKCSKYRLSTDLVLALIAVESGYKKDAKSRLGEYYGKGLMQVSTIVLTEYNWNHYNEKEHEPYELYGITFNIEVGCWYLARLRDHYKIDCTNLGNLLSAYNAGAYGGYQLAYVNKVQKVLNKGVITE